VISPVTPAGVNLVGRDIARPTLPASGFRLHAPKAVLHDPVALEKWTTTRATTTKAPPSP
jgi:hypothetical protein